MKLKIQTVKNLPIGVDLGSSSIKIAQLRPSAGGMELLAAGSAEVPSECRSDPERRRAFEGEKISKLLKSGGFKGRRAIMCLPAAATFVEPVKVPVATAAEVEEMVTAELRGKLPYRMEDAVVRHILAGTVYSEGKEMQERIIVAVARSDLDSYLAMARHAGLDVVGVNIEACAVVECFARMFRRASDESRVTLLIDIGSASTQVILAEGRRMVFARNLPTGGHDLDKVVAEKLQVSVEHAQAVRREMLGKEGDEAAEEDLFRLLDAKIAEMTDEITRCIRYYGSVFRDQSVERVIFVGGQAHVNRLCQSIAQRLNLPAQVGDPMKGVKRAPKPGQANSPQTDAPLPAWTVAIGLSLGATLAA